MLFPIHRTTDELGLPMIDKMVSLDLTDDANRVIGEKIAAIHADRFGISADLRDLVSNLGSYEGSGTR